MSNLCQPQGVLATILLASGTVFYPVEFKDANGETVIPSTVQVDATNHSGGASLAVNDGLLRTEQDSMSFVINNQSGSALNLELLIAKQPLEDITFPPEPDKDHFVAMFPFVINPAQNLVITLRQAGGQYFTVSGENGISIAPSIPDATS